MKHILTRRSIRQYSGRDIEPKLLNRLLTEAARTQTMGNLQLYSVVVTRSVEGKAALAPAHFNQPMVTQAPVVLTICADFRRTSKWAECRKAKPGYDNALSFTNAATDALLYTQTFCNLAEDAGLGLCFLGTTIYMPLPIIEALKLPKLVFPVATLTVGWPAEEPPLSDRLPLESRFYSEKEARPENQEFVRINKKETLAQIFTDIRYTKKDNEMMSKGLLAALRHQGFLGENRT